MGLPPPWTCLPLAEVFNMGRGWRGVLVSTPWRFAEGLVIGSLLFFFFFSL